jgi:hypothetical protein
MEFVEEDVRRITSVTPQEQVTEPEALSPAPRFNLTEIKLKSKLKFYAFCDYDITSYIGHRGISCAERMREFDLFRFHTPTEEERTEIHLPTARLNLHSTKEIFYLCGGLVGVRFDSDELHKLADLAHKLSVAYERLVNVFETFHLVFKKFKIPIKQELPCENTNAVSVFHQLGDEYLQVMIELQQLVRNKQKTIGRDAYYNHGK